MTDGQGRVLVFVEADVLRLLTESAIARPGHDGGNFVISPDDSIVAHNPKEMRALACSGWGVWGGGERCGELELGKTRGWSRYVN